SLYDLAATVNSGTARTRKLLPLEAVAQELGPSPVSRLPLSGLLRPSAVHCKKARSLNCEWVSSLPNAPAIGEMYRHRARCKRNQKQTTKRILRERPMPTCYRSRPLGAVLRQPT